MGVDEEKYTDQTQHTFQTERDKHIRTTHSKTKGHSLSN